MAAAFVTEDLRCHICQNPYTDPVSLPCGDEFCRVCIVQELDTQEQSREYSCPKCGEGFDKRPLMLHKKRRLCVAIPCTYCDDLVPAEKMCLHCDASFCAKHLSRHSSAPGHVLKEPTMSSGYRKCTEHWQVLNHLCIEDNSLFCSLCYQCGDHKFHEVVPLQIYTTEMEHSNLKLLLRSLMRKRQAIDSHINSLEANKEAQIEDARNMVSTHIENLKRKLDDLQNKVLIKVSDQKREFSILIADWKKKLEDQKGKMSEKIDHLEKLRNIRDPLTFLKEILDTDLIEVFSDEPSSESAPLFDEMPISVTLHEELLRFADELIRQMLQEAFPKMKKSEITLDIRTAHCNIVIRGNLRTAFYKATRQARVAGPERFRSRHVLSKCSFSSGNHYWEVEVKGMQCSIGVAYDNIERKTTRYDSRIGYNKRSWSLSVESKLSACHNDAKTRINTDSPVRAFGVFLEYSAGRLSFYQLCDPIRHLHTFTTTFTRPLHAAFYIFKGSKVTIRN